jgi:hypothetical protein
MIGGRSVHKSALCERCVCVCVNGDLWKPGMSWCRGHCARSQGTHVLPPSWFTWSPLLALTRSQHLCWHQEGSRTRFIFGEYCYLKQRKFEVRTGSDMFRQVWKNPTIFDPRTTPGVWSGPLPLPEPELRFGSGLVQVRNRLWTGQWQHYWIHTCYIF